MSREQVQRWVAISRELLGRDAAAVPPAPKVRTHPLYACPDKLACVSATGCEGVVAQQIGPARAWAFVGTPPGQEPRVLGWAA
jgi:hypothetical protein